MPRADDYQIFYDYNRSDAAPDDGALLSEAFSAEHAMDAAEARPIDTVTFSRETFHDRAS